MGCLSMLRGSIARRDFGLALEGELSSHSWVQTQNLIFSSDVDLSTKTMRILWAHNQPQVKNSDETAMD